MATSIGEGAARGIEAGFGMGQAFLNRRDQEEQRRLQREQQQALDIERQSDREFNRTRLVAQDERLARHDQRQVVQDERQQNLDAEGALAQEFADLQAEGKGLLEQHGDFTKVPKDLGDSYALRVKDTRGRLTAARARRYAPIVEDQRRQAGELWSKIQTGQVPLEQVPDDQLVTSLTALTRRDITDLMPGPGGAPSPVQQAGLDFMAAAETGNDDLMLSAANTLFKPELMIGVGGPGRDGSEILSKKIVQLIPHPNDPQHFTPLLEVRVRREDGKVGTYRAPVTENRSSDPDDNIRTISMQDGLERVGQLTTLAEALNQRGILDKLQAGQKAAGDGPKNFLEAFYATGGQKPVAKKVDIGQFEDFGGYKVHYLPDGRQVRIDKTPTPRAAGVGGGGGSGKESQRIRDLRVALDSGEITQEEFDAAYRQALKIGGGAGGAAGAGKATEDERKAAGWLSQARFAYDNMMSAIGEDPGAASPSVMQEMVGAIPKVGTALKNTITSEARQKFEQASSSFAEAALRAATGAGVTESEARQKIRELTPQIGDKPGQIAQKKEALQVYLQSLEARAGRAVGMARPAGATPSPAQPAGPAAAALNATRPAVDLGPSRVPPRPQAAQQPQQIGEGSIAVNPATGQKIQLRNGQWQPV
jgi:hypothetical protein